MLNRVLFCFIVCLGSAPAQAAEPLAMILLDVLRSHIASSIESSLDAARRNRERAALTPRPLYDLEDRELKTLIDEGFVHLSAAQRREVLAEVKRALSDPSNAHLRPMIVQELAIKASAVRQAHEKLANLSVSEKRAVAVEARAEFERMAPEEREQMLGAMRAGLVPIPRDLTQLILAEFASLQVEQAPGASEPAL